MCQKCNCILCADALLVFSFLEGDRNQGNFNPQESNPELPHTAATFPLCVIYSAISVNQEFTESKSPKAWLEARDVSEN